MITNVKGDLLKMFNNGAFDVIVHGCNCFHLMGAGIAGQIAEQYPEALEVDRQTLYGDIDKLGRYSLLETDNGFIVNGYTQFRPGQEEKTRLYSSISTLFDNLSDNLDDGSKIGIPWIGAGIAGGEWSVIQDIIRTRMSKMKVFAVEYVPPKTVVNVLKGRPETRWPPGNKDKIVMSEYGLFSDFS